MFDIFNQLSEISSIWAEQVFWIQFDAGQIFPGTKQIFASRNWTIEHICKHSTHISARTRQVYLQKNRWDCLPPVFGAHTCICDFVHLSSSLITVTTNIIILNIIRRVTNLNICCLRYVSMKSHFRRNCMCVSNEKLTKNCNCVTCNLQSYLATPNCMLVPQNNLKT